MNIGLFKLLKPLIFCSESHLCLADHRRHSAYDALLQHATCGYTQLYLHDLLQVPAFHLHPHLPTK